MKKHPVDDLFKRKLADLEKKPSAGAWLKIQENTKSRRRPVAWIWYAAASVTIALLAGYVVWENNQTNIDKQIGDQKAMAVVKQKMAEKGKETSQDPDTHLEEAKAEPAGAELAKTDVSVKVDNPKVKAEKSVSPAVIAQQKQELADIQPSNISEEKAPSTLNSITPIKSPEPVEVALTKPAANESDLPEGKMQKAEQSIKIVVAVEEPEDQSEKPKTSRFSRVFRQLKNARAGEKVDWDEVGFNPKNLVARVDDRLRTKEEKSSDKNQNSRERTKL
ncbi:hypothetical protein [Dyadobacter luticola]|uniref:Uncharacterized protein n=1 Tax=Dyadobacter luticola TaxID=1979387 RepID=A0A5R9KPA0_9BACT|nr:hypothetical protein [Dyadobacter luticola]TLU98115.1 hypothetical protein FEN17_25365 [Dyadobacter luticola]